MFLGEKFKQYTTDVLNGDTLDRCSQVKMVLKTETNIKPDYLSCFHADLIESLMQGIGYKNTIHVKGSNNAKHRTGQQIFPPLNLFKVRKALEEQASSRRELSAHKKKETALQCTGVQLRSCETQTDSVRSPKKGAISFRENVQQKHDARVGKKGLKEDREKPQSDEILADADAVKEQTETRPVLHHVTLQMDFSSATAALSGNKKNDYERKLVDSKLPGPECSGAEMESGTKMAKEEVASCEAKVPKTLQESKAEKSPASKATPATPAPQASGEAEPNESTPRKSGKSKLQDLKQNTDKKVLHKSPRFSDTKPITKGAVKHTKVKSLKMPDTTKSLVPIGFGGAPVEAVQTSRPSRVVILEASPRVVLTDRSSYQHNKEITLQLPSHIQFKQWETFMTPETVLEQYGSCLTEYEKREILKVREVYYIGNPQQKIQASDTPGPCNFGFDNDRGDYNAVMHDHIAYRYEILGKLGKGSFGQVLKCNDHKYKTTRALKIIRNKKQFIQQAFIEINLLEFLRDKAAEEGADYNIVTIFESFDFRGHLCISFPVHDISLYDMLKMNNFEGMDLSLIKCFAKQLLVALEFLHRVRIIHGDLKPENILLQHPCHPKIKLIDFGSSCFEHERLYTYIQSRFYRAPEVILGLPYDMMIDVWSFACILAELFTGFPLFPGEDEVEQLACIMEILGTPPQTLLNQAKRKKMFFDATNKPRIVPNSSGAKHVPSSKTLKAAIGCSDASFVDFLACCLKWDKEKRMTPQQLLQHQWMTQVRLQSPGAICYSRQSSKRRSTKGGRHKSVKQTKLSYSTRA